LLSFLFSSEFCSKFKICSDFKILFRF
jgi:hypothetical protein